MSKPCIAHNPYIITSEPLFGDSVLHLNMSTGGNLTIAGMHELDLLETLNFSRVDLLRTEYSNHVKNFKVTQEFLQRFWEIDRWLTLWGSNGKIVEKAQHATQTQLTNAVEHAQLAVTAREHETFVRDNDPLSTQNDAKRARHLSMVKSVGYTNELLRDMLKIRNDVAPLLILMSTPIWNHLLDVLQVLKMKNVSNMEDSLYSLNTHLDLDKKN